MSGTRQFLVNFLGAFVCLSSAMAEAPLSPAIAKEPDLTVVPGKRVGEITRKSTLAQLIKTYGEKNVNDTELPGVEGETYKAAVIFGGTDKELHVVWNFEKPGQEVDYVSIIGSNFVVEKTLKVGSPIEAVETANGGPFKLTGFGWDMGGFANFEGGKLAAKVMVRFSPQVEDYPSSVSGDVELRSDNKKVRQAKPVVSELSILFD